MIVLITDPRKNDAELASIATLACGAIPKGELAILLRDQTRDDDGVLELATQLRQITREAGQLFFVTKRHLRLAYEVGADGLHVAAPQLWSKRIAPRIESEKGILSAPCHSLEDFSRIAESKIDWALVSPIFATPNKGEPRGLSAIVNAAKIKGDRELPKIIALGGVDAENARSCIDAGADGVAVIRAILDAPDPQAASRALWNAVIASRER